MKMKTYSRKYISLSFVLSILATILVYFVSTIGTNTQQHLAKIIPKDPQSYFKSIEAKHLNDQTLKIINVTFQNKINDITIITVAEYDSRFLVLNWLASLKKNDFNRFVVFCNDAELFDFLSVQGYLNNLAMISPKWLNQLNNTITGNRSASSNEFSQLFQVKLNVWRQLLEYDLEFVYSEPDVVGTF